MPEGTTSFPDNCDPSRGLHSDFDVDRRSLRSSLFFSPSPISQGPWRLAPPTKAPGWSVVLGAESEKAAGREDGTYFSPSFAASMSLKVLGRRGGEGKRQNFLAQNVFVVRVTPQNRKERAKIRE
uniref:Uncharacterized protein n=1 Tax=Bursaphelenchus xylophilus TaxID=6326 RepID=A0A1I7SLA1_BURXY